MSYSPATIANYFLEKASSEGRALTPMQLLKLVYIAHGWHLGYGAGPLIDESVQAWRYGPVIHSLYKQIQKYGSSAVQEPLQTGPFPWMRDAAVSPNDALLLDQVWMGYGHYSGIELSNMTHLPGSPWWTTWNELDGKSEYFAVIDDELIRAFYESKIQSIRQARTQGLQGDSSPGFGVASALG